MHFTYLICNKTIKIYYKLWRAYSFIFTLNTLWSLSGNLRFLLIFHHTRTTLTYLFTLISYITNYNGMVHFYVW